MHVFIMFILVGILSVDLNSERLSINLMWLNKALDPSKTSIFPEDEKASNQKILEIIRSWGSKNPENDAQITFWYDSRKSEKIAIDNSREFIVSHLDPAIAGRLNFSDLNSLNIIEKYKIFFGDEIPVYFQSDILRFLIAIEAFEKNQCDLFLYADLNVESESRAELLDERTMNFLNDFGIVMMRHRYSEHPTGGHLGFENKFMMLKHDPVLLSSIIKGLIEPLKATIEYYKKIRGSENYIISSLEQTVYGGIEALFYYLFHEKGKIFISNLEEVFPYSILQLQGSMFLWKTEELIVFDPVTKETIYGSGGLVARTREFYFTKDELIRKKQDGFTKERKRISYIPYNEQREKYDTLDKEINKFNQDPEKYILEEKAQLIEKKLLNRLKLAKADLESALSMYEDSTEKPPERWHRRVENLRGKLEILEQKYERFKTNPALFIAEEEDNISWPKNLPIPAKIMIAPKSHFG